MGPGSLTRSTLCLTWSARAVQQYEFSRHWRATGHILADLTSPNLQHLPSRGFQTSAPRRSGHNRWSKIKHDKGKEDSLKSKARTLLSRDIYNASRCQSHSSSLCQFRLIIYSWWARSQLQSTSRTCNQQCKERSTFEIVHRDRDSQGPRQIYQRNTA